MSLLKLSTLFLTAAASLVALAAVAALAPKATDEHDAVKYQKACTENLEPKDLKALPTEGDWIAV